MDKQRALQLISDTWDQSVVARLCEYISIPNQSPLFDSEWQVGFFVLALSLAAR